MQANRYVDLTGSYPLTTAAVVNYFNYKLPSSSSVITTQKTSMSFTHLYPAAALGCVGYATERDAPHCNVLSHLCVLQTYDLQSPVRSATGVVQRDASSAPMTVTVVVTKMHTTTMIRGAVVNVASSCRPVCGAGPDRRAHHPIMRCHFCCPLLVGPGLPIRGSDQHGSAANQARLASLAHHHALHLLSYVLRVLLMH